MGGQDESVILLQYILDRKFWVSLSGALPA